MGLVLEMSQSLFPENNSSSSPGSKMSPKAKASVVCLNIILKEVIDHEILPDELALQTFKTFLVFLPCISFIYFLLPLQ